MQVIFSLIVIVFGIILYFWNWSHYLLLKVQAVQDKIYRPNKLRTYIQLHPARLVAFFCRALCYFSCSITIKYGKALICK